MSTVYQSGADTYEVNDLLLYSENTESLYLMLQTLFAGMYKQEKDSKFLDMFHDNLSVFTDACIKEYRKEIGPIKLTKKQIKEFIGIHMNEYNTYKFDNKLV